jgi:hypothetical protein
MGLNIYINFKVFFLGGLNPLLKKIIFGGPKARAWVA